MSLLLCYIPVCQGLVARLIISCHWKFRFTVSILHWASWMKLHGPNAQCQDFSLQISNIHVHPSIRHDHPTILATSCDPVSCNRFAHTIQRARCPQGVITASCTKRIREGNLLRKLQVSPPKNTRDCLCTWEFAVQQHPLETSTKPPGFLCQSVCIWQSHGKMIEGLTTATSLLQEHLWYVPTRWLLSRFSSSRGVSEFRPCAGPYTRSNDPFPSHVGESTDNRELWHPWFPWRIHGNCIFTYMGVSKNNGTPKSSILTGFSMINHPFWSTPIFGNSHLDSVDFQISMDPMGFLNPLVMLDVSFQQRQPINLHISCPLTSSACSARPWKGSSSKQKCRKVQEFMEKHHTVYLVWATYYQYNTQKKTQFLQYLKQQIKTYTFPNMHTTCTSNRTSANKIGGQRKQNQ